MERRFRRVASAAGRRRAGAIASVTVNAAMLLVAFLAHNSPIGDTDASPSSAITLTLLPPVQTRRPPNPTLAAHVTRYIQRFHRLRDHTQPIQRGPPTETPESLQERLRSGTDAQHSDTNLTLRCNVGSTRASHRQFALVGLLLRIGIDGSVLESEVEQASGDPQVDESVRRCAQDWGPFPLTIVDGRIVESWQRISWDPASTTQTP